MDQWVGDYFVCAECTGVFYENKSPYVTLVPQHRGHYLLALDRAHVSPDMTYPEAVAVAWALEIERAKLLIAGPPPALSNGFRPQGWADARNEQLQRVSSDIAVVYDEPSRQLHGFAVVGNVAIRGEFADVDEAEVWLAQVIRDYNLTHCFPVIFGQDHPAFWAERLDCTRVWQLAGRRS